VVIHYFHVLGSRIGPSEADSPLVVYADAVLPCAVAPQRFQAVAGRYAQILQTAGDLKLTDFASGNHCDIREPSAVVPLRELFGQVAFEGYDHGAIMTPCVMHVKRDEFGARLNLMIGSRSVFLGFLKSSAAGRQSPRLRDGRTCRSLWT
jgi:hypothetical protein